ncbi:MAG: hypothetical protein WBP26_02645 [Candidatus Saccharimonadales bacterium]
MKRPLRRGSDKRFAWPKVTFEFNWKIIALYGAGFAFVCTLYLWNIGSLPGGYSKNEALQAIASSSLSEIWQNPVGSPHKLLTYWYGFFVNDLLATRLASVTFAILAVILFYILVRQWHSKIVSVWATLLFAAAASMLHIGRWGGEMIVPAAMLLALLVIGLYAKYGTSNYSVWPLLCCTLLIAGSLYVPGMVWIVLLLLILGWRTGAIFLGRYSMLFKAGALALLLVLLIPLVWYIAKQPADGLLAIAGFSQHPATITDGLKAVGFAPIHAFYGGYQDSELWLGKVPLLDAFSLTMLLLGIYYYVFRYRKLKRSPLIICLVIFSFLLTSLSDYWLIPLFIVGIFFLISAGLQEMSNRWLTVFPRNPLAKNTGLVLLSCMVALAMFYNMQHYFVAWPKAPETKQVYIVQRNE